MGEHDLHRLKADASGNTALSERLAEAVEGFGGTDDAIAFLKSRGFDISVDALDRAAREEEARQDGELGEGEGGYGALLRFIAARGHA